MEKKFNKGYAGSMLGFSWKRFLIILGISVVVWLASVLIQAFRESPKYIAFFTQSKCSATGYPFATCIKGIPEEVIYLINILFWFWVIHLFGKWFEKSRQ